MENPFSLVHRALGYIRDDGWRDTAARVVAGAALRLAPAEFRKRAHSLLGEVLERSTSTYYSGEEMAASYLMLAEDELKSVLGEFSDLAFELRQRQGSQGLSHPAQYAIGSGTLFFLYAAVRAVRPSLVLETGVANGCSSFYFLNAMLKNGCGVLHSVDVSADVAGCLSECERDLWTLHVLQGPDYRANFADVISRLKDIDLFLHDSNHCYRWMRHEYETVFPKLSRTGLLASDDVDNTYAFVDFCDEQGIGASLLVDRVKIFGIAAVGARPQDVPGGKLSKP